MQNVISFDAIAIAQYIYKNNTSAIKERPQETSCFSIFLDTQQNKNCSNILSRHGTELWMPDFLIILFFGPSVMLTTDSKKWQIFRPICVLMKFDHIWAFSQVLVTFCLMQMLWPNNLWGGNYFAPIYCFRKTKEFLSDLFVRYLPT